MQLPALLLNDDEMVDTIVHWIDLVAQMLTSETGHLMLRKGIQEALQKGTIGVLQVIEAARAGHEDADLALRQLIIEKLDRHEDLPVSLASYNQEALFRGPTIYPAGRNIADTWTRDIGIAVLVALAIAHWPPLRPTRNRASKRPSGCSLVTAALNMRGHPLGERHVERIFADHGKIAVRLSASIPPQ
jgi:hypothetical protein